LISYAPKALPEDRVDPEILTREREGCEYTQFDAPNLEEHVGRLTTTRYSIALISHNTVVYIY